jgi:DNA polymerase-1
VIVHLVDASPYIFRGHFTLPDTIKAPDGRPMAASYGFASFLLKLIGDEKPTHLGVAFDRHLNSNFFRNRLYPDYKRQRAAPPKEIEDQIDTCVEIAAALGAATFLEDRYEADDILGTLCDQLERKGHGAVIVTTDKDLCQLVTARTALFDFAKGTRYGPGEVQEKFGVRPDQITDFLALAGDSVDNIPGVKGIGPKSAADLLARFDHLENLYEHLDDLRRVPLRSGKSLHAALSASRDLAFLSRDLATVIRDVPGVKGDLKTLKYQGADFAQVEQLFDRLGFKKIRERVQEASPRPRE